MSVTSWPAEVAHLPVCPRRGLPIPYIAEVTAEGIANFGILDAERHRECLDGRLCAMCGKPMDGEREEDREVALLGDVKSLQPGGFYVEPPVHERCGEIALGGLCPFISREGWPRRTPEEGVTVLGDREALREVGRTVAKRPMVMAVCRDYSSSVMLAPDGMMPVYHAVGMLRVRRYRWVGGLAAELLPEEVRTVRHQPRRASRSERRGGRR